LRTVTNLFAKPNTLSDPAWERQRGGAASAPACTDNFALAPDGSFTASRVQMNAGLLITGSDNLVLHCRFQNCQGGGVYSSAEARNSVLSCGFSGNSSTT
jgi:hypothetical protein